MSATARRSRKKAAEPMASETGLGEPPPAIGHNHPEAASLGLTDEGWAAWLDHVFEAVDARSDELLASFERFALGFPVIPDDDVQGRAGDLKDKIQALVKTAEALHTIEKAPILVAQRAVDGKLRAFKGRFLETDSKGRLIPNSRLPLNVITTRQTAYAQRKVEESRRIAAEEAKRLADEAAAAMEAAAQSMAPAALQEAVEASQAADQATAFAAAPAAEHARTHGPMGSTTALYTIWRFHPEDSDLMALCRAVVAGTVPLAYVKFNEVRIGVAIRTEKVREIPGCVITQEQTAR